MTVALAENYSLSQITVQAKALDKSAFNVSTIRFNTCKQADVPLPDCSINDIRLFNAKLHGKGSTHCGNFDSTSTSIISCIQLSNFGK